MAEFRDHYGRPWQIRLTPQDLRLLRGLGIDLSRSPRRKLLFDAVFALLEQQRLARQLAPREFARAMSGESGERAIAALQQAYDDFSNLNDQANNQ